MQMFNVEGTPFSIMTLNGVNEVIPETMMLSLFYNGRSIPDTLLKENDIFLPCSVSKIPEAFEFTCMMAMGTKG